MVGLFLCRKHFKIRQNRVVNLINVFHIEVYQCVEQAFFLMCSEIKRKRFPYNGMNMARVEKYSARIILLNE